MRVHATSSFRRPVKPGCFSAAVQHPPQGQSSARDSRSRASKRAGGDRNPAFTSGRLQDPKASTNTELLAFACISCECSIALCLCKARALGCPLWSSWRCSSARRKAASALRRSSVGQSLHGTLNSGSEALRGSEALKLPSFLRGALLRGFLSRRLSRGADHKQKWPCAR